MGEPILFWGATGQAIVLHEFLCAREQRLVALVDRDLEVVSPFPGCRFSVRWKACWPFWAPGVPSRGSWLRLPGSGC